ncbi:hypothetical protein Scep_018555 [Stephania cephalantha]|uniref:Uncharacterized protein n=1 Tax=Stephania cephalantha TaxID=152367 RepID=A0AAP0I958_9MAGN
MTVLLRVAFFTHPFPLSLLLILPTVNLASHLPFTSSTAPPLAPHPFEQRLLVSFVVGFQRSRRRRLFCLRLDLGKENNEYGSWVPPDPMKSHIQGKISGGRFSYRRRADVVPFAEVAVLIVGVHGCPYLMVGVRVALLDGLSIEQLPQVTDEVNVEASTAHDSEVVGKEIEHYKNQSESSSSDSSEEEQVEVEEGNVQQQGNKGDVEESKEESEEESKEGAEKEEKMRAGDGEQGGAEEGKDEDSEEGSTDKKKMRTEKGEEEEVEEREDGDEGEEEERDDEENEIEEERSRGKAHGKATSSRRKVVQKPADDPSRPISGGPIDRCILNSFNNHVAAAICVI